MAQEPLILAVGVVGAPGSGKSWLIDAFGRCAGPGGDVELADGSAARCVCDGALTKLHGAFELKFLCAQRVEGVLLNISAKFWRISSPD